MTPPMLRSTSSAIRDRSARLPSAARALLASRPARESLVARAKGPEIGALAKFGATGRPGRQILDKAAAGARRPHDVLDQQLAALVREVPAVDVDVFGIGMHIGDARIRAARAVDADIVRIFAPAHGAD